jgi:hypothetical protein
MTRHRVLAVIAALLSAGWIAPLLLGVDAYLSFWQVEGWPLLRGERPLNSFPFLAFSGQCVRVALVWLGLVVFFWSYMGCVALARRRAA